MYSHFILLNIIYHIDVECVRLVTESKLGNERNFHNGRSLHALHERGKTILLGIMLIMDSLVWTVRILASSFT